MEERKRRIFFKDPLFFPSLPFFYGIMHSDLWVVLDHLKFRSRSTQTHCKLKSSTGEIHTVGVPIKYPTRKPFHQMCINNFVPWKRGFLACIRNDYEDTEYYEVYIDALKSFIDGPCIMLETLNMNSILWVCGLLKMTPSYFQTRTLYTKYPKSKTISALCSQYNAEQFKPDVKLHTNNREKGLSVLDALFRNGADRTLERLQKPF